MLIAGPNPSSGSLGNVLALVANASFAELDLELAKLGYRATAIDNPYAAFIELLERPLVYRALVVSLPALYREELALIKTVRARLPHLDILLAHTDGRHAALAEAMRLGATALLSEAAVHRLADIEPLDPQESAMADESNAPPADDGSTLGAAHADPHDHHHDDDTNDIEPLLTADELRALLQEQPTLPPP